MSKTAAVQTIRRMLMGATAGVSLMLTGCYVVPMQPVPGGPVQTPAQAAASVHAPVMFNARMYPANDAAAPYGAINGNVTNDLNGRGVFTATIRGETYTGEATRSTSSSREGIANGVGSKGGWMRCTYRMNSSTLGTGECSLDNGARFVMHVGN